MSFSEWEEVKLEDCSEIIFSGGTPSTSNGDYWNGGINWLSSGETRHTFITGTEKLISRSGVNNSSTKLAKKHDVVIASAGQGNTRGQTSICMIDTYINQSIIAIRADKEKLDPYYLFYNIYGRYSELRKISDGHSIRGSLTTKIIKDLKIVLPPIKEQQVIGNILSTLDEKIEVNNKLNKTLEEIAQAIFKHWFVDFEFPNEEGKPYKSSGGEMIDSELGLIPNGWKIGVFRDYISNTLGGDWGKDRSEDNHRIKVRCIRGADINEVANGRKGNIPIRYILEKNYNTKRLEEGDLVVEISGGSPTQSTGRITFISEEILGRYQDPLICTNFCRAIRLVNKNNMHFVYRYWEMLYNNSFFFNFENGTTGIKNLDINSFIERFIIVKPSENIIKNFTMIMESINKVTQNNGVSNSSLESIRDTLLPKLMSGEIRVPKDYPEEQ